MIWSNELAEFVANAGRPEFREPATRVIRELDKFNNPEALNGIEPIEAGGAVGIGINYQRRALYLFGALFFFGLLIMFITLLGPVRLREPETGELSAFVLIIPMFGGFGLLSLLLYVKKPGPEVVIVANQTSLYLVSRAGLRFSPKEVLVPWSSDRVHIDLNTVTHNMITTHTVSLSRVRRDSGRKSRLFGTRVDEHLFRYWEQFAHAVSPFNR
jgi:hypothetical protein